MRWMTVGAVLVGGCGQFGEEEMLRCEELSRTSVAADDVVTLDDGEEYQLPVDDVVTLATGTFEETLRWERTGEETSVTLTLAAPTEIDIVTFAPAGSVSDGGTVADSYQVEAAVVCPTQLQLAQAATLETGDGRLNEAFDTVSWGHGTRSGVTGRTPRVVIDDHRIPSPQGTIDLSELLVADGSFDPDLVRVRVHLGQTGEPFLGVVTPLPLGAIDDDAAAIAAWPSGVFD